MLIEEIRQYYKESQNLVFPLKLQKIKSMLRADAIYGKCSSEFGDKAISYEDRQHLKDMGFCVSELDNKIFVSWS